ncbi:MAG: sugar phosphate isomerase/epimerase family protein [Armatimonadota bacterium]
MELGCFNRPWSEYDYDDALAGMAAAGYTVTGFMRQQKEALVDADSTPEQMEQLKAQVAKHGLSPSTVLGINPLGQPMSEAVEQFKRFIDNVAASGSKYILSCGTSKEEQYDEYYELMRQTSGYAADKGVVMTLKPHGGISATSRELLTALERVDHPNFHIYYDAGNVHFYTGESAAEDVKLIAKHAVGLCVKDNTGGQKGDVNIEPGTGEVDFDAVFGTLLDAGFDGPCIVECLGGDTLEDVNERAKRTRDFILKYTG